MKKTNRVLTNQEVEFYKRNTRYFINKARTVIADILEEGLYEREHPNVSEYKLAQPNQEKE